MRGRWVFAVLAGGVSALLLGWVVSGVGATGSSAPAADEGATATALVSYRHEGGIGGPRPSLVVSKGRRAKLTFGHCTTRFTLRRKTWNTLRKRLGAADLDAIAGDYPAAPSTADALTYVIESGGSTVRIAIPPQPRHEDVLRRLQPLLAVLDKVVATGKRRMDPSCESSRVTPR